MFLSDKLRRCIILTRNLSAKQPPVCYRGGLIVVLLPSNFSNVLKLYSVQPLIATLLVFFTVILGITLALTDRY